MCFARLLLVLSWLAACFVIIDIILGLTEVLLVLSVVVIVVIIVIVLIIISIARPCLAVFLDYISRIT